MKLWYYRDPAGNFGDDLNPWLWSRLLPGFFDGRPDSLFLGIGTIIRAGLPAAARKVVLGSGMGYGEPPHLDPTWEFHCVRGPLTAARLGLPASLAATDAAALVSTVFDGGRYPRRAVSFMPHHVSATLFDWRPLCRRLGIRYVDPTAAVEPTLAALAGSRLVIADAMHAAILADTLRVPWVPVTIYGHANPFKWNDWCASLDLNYEPVRLPAPFDNSNERPLRRLRGYARRIMRTRKLTRHGRRPDQEVSGPELIQRVADGLADVRDHPDRAVLSEATVFADRVARLTAALDQLRAGKPGFVPPPPRD
ncbi:MAG: polysaccharide pyruvyl transferase [Bacillota bacterium]|jgi:succinoglycan biosynthesis protein ExoV